MFKLYSILLLLMASFLGSASVAVASTATEQQCFNMIQGKVAWNKGGNTTWGPANIQNLCAGTTNPSATITCFKKAIRENAGWQKATKECKGVNSLQRPKPQQPPKAPAPVRTGPMSLLGSQSGYGCLELTPSLRVGNGYRVQTWKDCNNTWTHQKWSFQNNMATTTHQGKTYCLTAGNSNDPRVAAFPCNPNRADQRFVKTGAQTIQSGSRCLDATHANNKGTHKVIMYSCHNGRNQQWGTPVAKPQAPKVNPSTQKISLRMPHSNTSMSCNADPRARANGCSVPKEWKGMNIDWAYKDSNNTTFKSACNTHDVCYSSPWAKMGRSNGQKHCDSGFKRDLMKICDQKYGLNQKRKNDVIGTIFGAVADVVEEANPQLIACRVTAESMYGAVRDHGGGPFKSGQAWGGSNCSIAR